MKSVNNKAYGGDGELIAVKYLEQTGFRIINKNFRCRMGEIDIIAQEGNYLCFVEVKRRKTVTSGHPLEAIHPVKIQRICKTALFYMHTNRIPESTAVRFDVISVIDNEVSLLRDAFSFQI